MNIFKTIYAAIVTLAVLPFVILNGLCNFIVNGVINKLYKWNLMR